PLRSRRPFPTRRSSDLLDAPRDPGLVDEAAPHLLVGEEPGVHHLDGARFAGGALDGLVDRADPARGDQLLDVEITADAAANHAIDRKSTRLHSSHVKIS